MDVLCSDKTGTLTAGTVEVDGAYDSAGDLCDEVLRAAFINASLRSGFSNPIDTAIRAGARFDLSGCRKLGEIPYDFVRKRLSIAVDDNGTATLLSKGAVANIVAACTTASLEGRTVAVSEILERINAQTRDFSARGLRTIGVARRLNFPEGKLGSGNEADMTFLGVIALKDPVKLDAVAAVDDLRSLGVGLKIISGDNRLIAESIMRHLADVQPNIVTGPEIRRMSDEALRRRVVDVDCFAEVEPNQKKRIVRALQKAGHVVGYVGDGINDASALHAADVGLSVDTAVDVAKEAADLVLLDKSLSVIGDGIREGRRTFANTLKYVFMAVGANFANVFSMAGASLIFPFLPLLPKQILLANLMTDLPAMTIATDNVDEELIGRPRRWDITWIRKFMWTFGPLSSVFDFLTFAVLALGFHVAEDVFRTAWFLESVVSAVVVVLLLRSRRAAVKSRPSRYLLGASVVVALVALMLPYAPFADLLGFAPLSWPVLTSMLGIVAAYAIVVEAVKRRFFERTGF